MSDLLRMGISKGVSFVAVTKTGCHRKEMPGPDGIWFGRDSDIIRPSARAQLRAAGRRVEEGGG